MLPRDTHIAVLSTRLPGQFHGDPADRFIVATGDGTTGEKGKVHDVVKKTHLD